MSVDSGAPAVEDAGYSRVTLIGRTRRADFVLPSGDPIGALIPDILDVLGEVATAAPQRLALTTVLGDLLPADVSLAGAGVADGTVLRLVAEDEIPPPPVVNDITEETAADLEGRRGRWTDRARYALAVGAAAGLAGLAAVEVAIHHSSPTALIAILAVAGAGWLAALALAVAARRELSVALVACAAAGVVAAASALPDGLTGADRIGIGAGAVWVAVAVGGLAWRARGPLLGAAFGLLFAGAWVGLRRSELTAAEADGLVLLASVVAFGLLPRWAVGLSGLARLDDRRLSGDLVSRHALESSLVDAHTALAWSTVAASSGVGIAGTALALSGQPWAAGLAGASALVALLRARALPLVVEVVAVAAATAAVLVGLALAWSDTASGSAGPLAATLAATVLALAAAPVRPPAHIRARLRGLADRVESLAVLALVPLLIGVFGVFGRLLHTF